MESEGKLSIFCLSSFFTVVTTLVSALSHNLIASSLLTNFLPLWLTTAPSNSIPDFAESKAKREFYLAELAKLDVEEKKKQLVSVDEIKKSSFAKARSIREALTNLADRLSHQLAGEDDATVIHNLLSTEHREALENLAQ